MYYILAAIVLVVVVVIIIAMQGLTEQPPTLPPTGGESTTPQPPKAETKVVAEDVAKQLNLQESELPLRVTMDDNGQTYSATPGKNIVLMLGDNYDWGIASGDSNVVSKRDVKYTDARVQAVYQVVGEGKTQLTATGTCKKGSQCATPTASFTLKVEGVISENESMENLVK